MILIQLTGLSGAGKTTLAQGAKVSLEKQGYAVEVIDGDVYRQRLWPELSFSPTDRQENIRRLSYLGGLFCKQGIIVFIAAINPYESVRTEVSSLYPFVRTVYVHCDLPTLLKRDTKGLYARALLPEGHPDKLLNLTGINAPYEPPTHPHLVLNTGLYTAEQCTYELVSYLFSTLPSDVKNVGTKEVS
jgi:adenylylsulfate kinase